MLGIFKFFKIIDMIFEYDFILSTTGSTLSKPKCIPSLSREGVEHLTKFSKMVGLKGSKFLEGGCWERWGVAVFT